MKPGSGWTAALCQVYDMLLYAYPREFRRRFGEEMRQVFRDRCRAAMTNAGAAAGTLFFLALAKDWILSSSRERITSMKMKARGAGVAALTVLVGLLASTTFLQAFVISGASMEGSLQVGDHILVDKQVDLRAIGRGDLVAFRYPEDPRMTLVKRVIGLPGDRIRLIDKQVIRNGRRLVEPYASHGMAKADAYRDNFPAAPPTQATERGLDMLAHHLAGGEVTVPAGSLFVLGDNRDKSIDSRHWGFVPRENVVGRPLLVYWSYAAPADGLTGWGWRQAVDVAEHFWTKTRWNRTLLRLGWPPPEEVQP